MSEVFLDQRLLLLDFKALTESGVAEDEFFLSIALGFLDLALALFAAEANLGFADGDIRVRIALGTGQWALRLSGLAGGNQLVVGLHSVLGGVLGECAWAVAAAEVNLSALVVSRLIFESWLTGNRAGGLERFGLFISGESHETDGQNGRKCDSDFANGHEKTFQMERVQNEALAKST